MKVELLHFTPIMIAIKAIRTCYNSCDKSDELGEKDIKLLQSIVKNKHLSTIEHLRILFKTTDNEIYQTFLKNHFSYISMSDINGTIYYYICTNMRVILEIDLPLTIKDIITPYEYKMLLKEC
ncbi:MAG: FAD-dependent thymidylate synthase [Campylobacter sp.]|nr:FAD-dependent thymidylate synthase [Campylobacter sp.]